MPKFNKEVGSLIGAQGTFVLIKAGFMFDTNDYQDFEIVALPHLSNSTNRASLVYSAGWRGWYESSNEDKLFKEASRCPLASSVEKN